MIPPFHNAVDNAISMLAQDGFLGVTDFFVSSKYDLPMRQMTWARRFFWRCVPKRIRLPILLACITKATRLAHTNTWQACAPAQ